MIDYPIVFVESPRTIPCSATCLKSARWAEFSNFAAVNPGTNLAIRWPDGKTETLVEGGLGAIQDPNVSFDGTKVLFTRWHVASPNANSKGADLYVIDLRSREITQLTRQEWAHPRGLTPSEGVYNIHGAWLPGGKIVFVSNRHSYHPPPEAYQPVSLQLHTIDADGRNIENIGHMNLGSALHPTVLTDGRICFSSLENMGRRNPISWGIWCIWQDGTVWSPLVSAFNGPSSPPGWHFMTQVSDTRLVTELYYNQNQKGFGTFFTLPLYPPLGQPAFGPGTPSPTASAGFPLTFWRVTPRRYFPFQPTGMALLTWWTRLGDDLAAWPSDPADLRKPFVGKVTHPSGAPDNHLLLVWSPGPIGGAGASAAGQTMIDSGLYLLPDTATSQSPADLVIIRNDPAVNEQWPRPVVPYKRIYGIAEPALLRSAPVASLPPGTPFGLIGSSSLYKRESAPYGVVPPDSVTAVSVIPGQGAAKALEEISGTSWNWGGQGSDAGRYTNDDIAELCIVTFEPNVWTPPPVPWGGSKGYPHFSSHAQERLRRLGCIDVHARKTAAPDPDGNPDTSFLAKIPADVPFTFQMLDHDGLVLTTAQTWHQVRPGEQRSDCGGCHAHSQHPTAFDQTQAGQPHWSPSDLTQPGRATTAEFYADIVPALGKCTGCHNSKMLAGNLRLDDMTLIKGLPQAYHTLARTPAYSVPGQARRSLVMWKLFGARLDGWANTHAAGDVDYPSDTTFDHTTALTPTERRTWGTWYDLYAMIALTSTGMRDDTPPTLTLASPKAGRQTEPLRELLLGMHDYGSDLDLSSLRITASGSLGGLAAGSNLAASCQPLAGWRWRCPLPTALTAVDPTTLKVQIQDRAGNRSTIERTFSIGR
ncbi:MAG: hypothetical protein AB7N91_20390 [Candidatus Tectimicrobiota bacterium]